MRYEHEKAVAGLHNSASARWDCLAVPADDGDQGIVRQAELADRGSVDGVVAGDCEVDEV
jgi:hypothetical protein